LKDRSSIIYNIFVGDRLRNSIQKFNSNGLFLEKFVNDPNPPNNGSFDPRKLAVVPPPVPVPPVFTLYVTDLSNSRVQKLDSNGNFLSMWGYGVDDGTAVFQICTSGCLRGILGPGDGQFGFPRGIDVDSSDNIIVSGSINNRVQTFGSNENFLSKFGNTGTGNGQFNNPFNLALDSLGNILVVDVTNHNVQKFKPDGTFLLEFGGFGSGDEQFNQPTGIAVDSSDNIIVADQSNSRVQKFDSNGNFIQTISSLCRIFNGDGCVDPDGAGPLQLGDGQTFRPRSVAVDSSDNIYVF